MPERNSSSDRSAAAHNLRHRTEPSVPVVVRFVVLAGLLFFSSSAVLNRNGSNVIAYAQLANNNNSVFLDNGPNSDKPPAFLDAYWTSNLSGNSSAPNNNVVKKEVGPGDGAAT